MRFLIIDDCPGRYDEFIDICYQNGDRFTITCDPESVSINLLEQDWDGILLDHDMPYSTGVEFAYLITSYSSVRMPPVVITSTTKEPGAREKMREIFGLKNVPCVINPADHLHCEIEWYWWLRGNLDA